MSYHHRHQQHSNMVGSLQLMDYNHWSNIGVEHWTNCGLSIQTSYSWRDRRLRKGYVCNAMVDLQRELVKSARCGGKKMVLSKVLSRYQWSNKEGRTSVYYRCPFHNDILPHWGKRRDIFICIYLAYPTLSTHVKGYALINR